MTMLGAVGALLLTFGPTIAVISAANMDGTRRLIFRGSLLNGIAQFIKLAVLASSVSQSALREEQSDLGFKTWITAALGVVDWYLIAYLLRDKYTALTGRTRVLAYALALTLSDLVLSHLPLIWQSMYVLEVNTPLLWASRQGTVLLVQRLAMTCAVWLWSRGRFSERPVTQRAVVWAMLILSCIADPIGRIMAQRFDCAVCDFAIRFIASGVLGVYLWRLCDHK